MRGRGSLLLTFLAGLGCASALAGGIEYRVAVLTGLQEVPVVPTLAGGCATFRIDTATNRMDYYIVYSGLIGAETAAHIHGFANPGANAGVKHALPAGSPKVGTWVYAEADEADILAGRTYVNIHSTVFGGGEIRGQITTHFAAIDGAQEVPATGSGALGWGVFNVDTDTNTMTYHIVHNAVGETAAHIHGYRAHGANAGVVHPLPAGSPKIGSWTYAEADENAILDGMTYVNIHTAAFGGGEIRGQICRTVTPIDGTQEAPPTASTAAGCGLFSIDRGSKVLGYDIAYTGLAGAETAAHIHGFAPPGVNAGVLHPLIVGPRKLGTWTYAAGDEAGILGGLTYVNIHSTVAAGGEIRGQIEPPPLPCLGDVNCDGVIDLTDLAVLLSNFGKAPAHVSEGDVDGDSDVDLTDLAILLSVFGTPCP